MPVGQPRPQRLEQLELAQQMAHRGRLPTGNHQGVDGVQLGAAAHGAPPPRRHRRARPGVLGYRLAAQGLRRATVTCGRREVTLVTGQSLLHHRRDHLAGLVEQLALGQRPPATRRRRGLVVQQPFVGAERPHEPHRVIQRRDHQVLALVGMIHLRRTQQRQVAQVGQRADVQHRIVGQRIGVPEPHLLLRSLAGQQGHVVARHDPHVPLGELREARIVEGATGAEAGQIVRRRRGRHRVLVLDAALIGLERRRHREDRLAVLDGVHPAGGERAAVAEAFDQVDRRRPGVARPQEVAVQRMHLVARVHRADRRHQ